MKMHSIPYISLILAIFTLALTTLYLNSYYYILANDLSAYPLPVYFGQYYRLLTSNFLHAHWPHVLSNLLFFMLIAVEFEKKDRRAFLYVFVTSLIVVQSFLIIYTDTWIRGISGGIAALLGFLLVSQQKGNIFRTLFSSYRYALVALNFVILSAVDLCVN